jgi:hypothetical protein
MYYICLSTDVSDDGWVGACMRKSRRLCVFWASATRWPEWTS